MKITTRPYLYKVVEPSNKTRVLTTWQDEEPIDKFEYFEKIKVPSGVTDTEINNTYREITKKRAEKLWMEKQGKPQDEGETNPETEQEI